MCGSANYHVLVLQAQEPSSSTANGKPPEDDMHLQQLEAIRVKIRVSLRGFAFGSFSQVSGKASIMSLNQSLLGFAFPAAAAAFIAVTAAAAATAEAVASAHVARHQHHQQQHQQ